MPQTLTIDFNKPIALFPLGNCVLLPHNATPLHIFEDRYRAMTSDALDATGLIAMATYAAELGDYNTVGQPPLRNHVCVGYIVQHDRLHDGRYNILLQGIVRARIEREAEPDPGGYRRAHLIPIEQHIEETELESRRNDLDLLLDDVALKQLAGISAVQNCATPELPTAALTDLAWNTVSRDREERYSILADPCAMRRADRLIGLLRQTRRTLQLAERMGPCTGEHGLGLN